MAQRLTTHGLGGSASQLLQLGFGAGRGQDASFSGHARSGGTFSAVKGYSATFTSGAIADGTAEARGVGPGYFTDGAVAGGSFTWLKPGEIYVPPFVDAVIARATLTGAPDSLPDLALVITSFSGSARELGEDQLTIICPDSPGLAAEIDARPNGDLLLDVGTRDSNGVETLVRILDVNLESVRPDYGPRSRRIALAGYKGVTYGPGVARSYTDVNYYSMPGGKRQARLVGVETGVRPGDTVTVAASPGNQTFDVGVVSYSMSYGGRRVRGQTTLIEA